MERAKRFELSTSSLARKRSSQLSYARNGDYLSGVVIAVRLFLAKGT